MGNFPVQAGQLSILQPGTSQPLFGPWRQLGRLGQHLPLNHSGSITDLFQTSLGKIALWKPKEKSFCKLWNVALITLLRRRPGILECSVCLWQVCLLCTLAPALGNSQPHKRSFIGVKRNMQEALGDRWLATMSVAKAAWGTSTTHVT